MYIQREKESILTIPVVFQDSLFINPGDSQEKKSEKLTSTGIL